MALAKITTKSHRASKAASRQKNKEQRTKVNEVKWWSYEIENNLACAFFKQWFENRYYEFFDSERLVSK